MTSSRNELGSHPQQPAEVHPSADTAIGVTCSGTATTRMNFAVQHLLLAARLAREVDAVEREHLGEDFGAFYDVVLGSSVGCIVMTVAGVEAYANELYVDREDLLTPEQATLLESFAKEYEGKRVIDKFDLAHRIRTGRRLALGDLFVQRLDRVVMLRNALVHFKPEAWHQNAKHDQLCSKLKNYAATSPWLQHEPIFPRAWATRGTTAWALESAVNFVREFSAATGLPDRVAKFRPRLSPISDDDTFLMT